MKIAITSLGNTLHSTIDPRFGRCAYFAIYDTETKKSLFLTNPAQASSEGAGPAAVQFIATQGVNKIIAGEFGGKIQSLLLSLDIAMQQESGKTISAIIDQF